MITIFRVFLSDVKRLRSNVVAIVIIMGLSIIPALYAWFNIMSNWDPYGTSATSQMKVAVCSQDSGVEIGSLSLNVGDEVITGLKENTMIGWVFTASKDEALEGVNSGDYYAALIVPESFTTDFISFLGGDPKNPTIAYYENSKKNAIATKITGKAKTAVQEQVNQKVISTLTEVLTESGKILAENDENGVDIVASTADQLDELDSSLQTYVNILNTFSLVTASASDLAESAQSLLINTQGIFDSGQDSVSNMQSSVLSSAQTADTVSSLIGISLDSVEQDLTLLSDQMDTLTVGDSFDSIRNQVDTAKTMSKSTISVLKDIFGETDQYVSAVDKSFKQLNTDLTAFKKDANVTAQSLKHLKRTIKADIKDCKNSIRKIRNTYQYQVQPDVSRSVLRMEQALIQTGKMLNNIESSFGTIDRALESYQTTLDSGTDDITATKDYIVSLQSDIRKLSKSLRALSGDEQYNEMMDLLKNDPTLMASFMASPVSMETKAVYPIETYGSAMAPFYTVLAIWVGALILVALIHVKVAPVENLKVRPWQAYFGRYITFFLIGQAQTAITVLGDLFYVDIQCPHPFLFWLASAANSFVFTLLIYSLTVAMGNVGEAVAVIVMVIQVAGAGGTFPIEVLPEVYQMIYKFLPFTYCMNALRECVGGVYKNDYWMDLRALGIYILISLFIGLVVAVPLRRLNKVIERSKEKSKVML
ncbi:MAG: YhgE/Pip domain-containing protein [Lachnobacterium sp.]|nr:YhgE/Pip domain-containing protein [Lachnobacterium sp.]